MVDIDRPDIQGDILEAYGNRYIHTVYVFLTIGDAVEGRAWLGERIPGVTTARRWQGPKPDSTFNIAVTHAGVLALGVPDHVAQSFSDEFIAGMAARNDELGDTGPSATEHWDAGLGTGAAHVLITINALSAETRDAALAALQSGIDPYPSISIACEQRAEMQADTREHFGFADGFSQPSIEGVSEDSAVGEGVREAKTGWRPLALGEFLLGHEDEESRTDRKRRLPSAPDDPLGRNGTYMVWRKLYQDVALFRRTLRDASAVYADGDETKLMAKAVGRWPNGAPVTVWPDAPPEQFDARRPGVNAFGYADTDQNGLGCPIGAHVRRSNPRDALGFDSRLTFRHRIIRRGMPYGPRLPEDSPGDDKDRGLVFVCFNASISRQFESVQRQWLNDGNLFHLGADRDFLLGGDGGKMTIQGERPFFLSPLAQFVITRGGEYLFVPSITALGAIADGTCG